MRRLLVPLLLGAAAALPLRSQDLPEPGDTLSWERVGDRPIKPRALDFDGAGVLYARRTLETFVLDLSASFPGVWVERYFGNIGDVLLGLGADTLLTATPGTTNRSLDGGSKWAEVYDDGTDGGRGLVEAPPGTPLAGALLLAASPVAVSSDRGATWEPRGHLPGDGSQIGSARALAALTSGRLVAGGRWGAAYSDDGGWTWTESSLWEFGRYLHDFVVVSERPWGEQRVVAVGVDATQAHVRAWYSDDGGATWLPEGGTPLPQPADGAGSESVGGLVWVGGPTVLAVMGRGVVYRSNDGGASWAEAGRVPEIDVPHSVRTAVVGPDGRLYVGLMRQGASEEGAWVWRTAEPVPVSSEPGPVEVPEGLGLEVRPNPVRGEATVALDLPAPSAVTAAVYDVLGRRVAVLHAGPLAAGTHAFRLDPSALPPGVYLVRAEAGGALLTRTVTLLR